MLHLLHLATATLMGRVEIKELSICALTLLREPYMHDGVCPCSG